MIGKLTGRIDEILADYVILDVHNVGYLVYLGERVLDSLSIGQERDFYIHYYVREDSIKLYGFLSKEDLYCFELLQDVPRLGAKKAFMILGFYDRQQLFAAIKQGDETLISRVPGIGLKVAKLIIAELQSKPIIKNMVIPESSQKSSETQATKSSLYADKKDAIAALVNLGYNRSRSIEIIERVLQEHGDIADTGMLLKYSLQKLSPLEK